MAKKPVYTNFWAEGGKLKVKHVYEDDFEYWRTELIAIGLFLLAFVVSAIAFFWNGVTVEQFDRLEFAFIAVVFTAEIIHAGISERAPRLMFALVCCVGIAWGIISLFVDWVTFNAVGYVFFYTGLIVFVNSLLLIKNLFR